MRKVLLAMVAALALLTFALPGTTVATSADTAACKQGGWQGLVRADGSAFRNQGDCVTYAARGGTPRPPLDAFQQLCASYEGTYAASTTLVGVPVAPYCDFRDGIRVNATDIFFACSAVRGNGSFLIEGTEFGCTA